MPLFEKEGGFHIKYFESLEVVGCPDCTLGIKVVDYNREIFFHLEVFFSSPIRNKTLLLGRRKDSKSRLFTVSGLSTESHASATRYLFAVTVVLGVAKASAIVSFGFAVYTATSLESAFGLLQHLNSALSFAALLRLVDGPYLGLGTWMINAAALDWFFGPLLLDYPLPISDSPEPYQDCRISHSLKMNQVSCSISQNYSLDLLLIEILALGTVGIFVKRIFSRQAIYLDSIFLTGLGIVATLIYSGLYKISAYSSLNLLRKEPSRITASELCNLIVCLSSICLLVYHVKCLRIAKLQQAGLLIDADHFFEDNLITLLRLGKMLASGVLAVLLIDHPTSQSATLLGIEAAYFYFFIRRTNRDRRLLTIRMETWVSACCCLLLILKMLSVVVVSETLLDLIGIVVFGLICSLICIIFCFTLSII